MPRVSPLGPDDPRRLGEYELTGRLGEGGQGVVYRGRTPGGTTVAIKLLRGGASRSARARTGFAEEVAAARRVTRGPAARVLAAEMTGDRAYVVSEYVDGPALQRAVTAKGPLPERALRRVALRTAAALAAIHETGIAHRDLTPANVLLGPEGPKVVDVGVARILGAATPATATAQPAGTPAYLAPEQADGEAAGPPADVFAWAAVVVFAATGRPPFGTGSRATVRRRVTERDPDVGDLGEPLRTVVLECLRRDPEARPTAADVLGRLRQAAEAAPAHPPAGRRWRTAAVVAAVVVTGFLLGLAAPWPG